MASKSILVPLDGSDFSRKALEQVTSLFAPEKCDVTLVRVGALPSYARAVQAPEYVPDGWSRMLKDYRSYEDKERAEHPVVTSQVWDNTRIELLDSLTEDVAALRKAGFGARALARFGDPVEEIVALTDTGRYDLIVMATHGRTGLERVVMGSVARGVRERVSIDLMLVQAGRLAHVKRPAPDRIAEPV